MSRLNISLHQRRMCYRIGSSVEDNNETFKRVDNSPRLFWINIGLFRLNIQNTRAFRSSLKKWTKNGVSLMKLRDNIKQLIIDLGPFSITIYDVEYTLDEFLENFDSIMNELEIKNYD